MVCMAAATSITNFEAAVHLEKPHQTTGPEKREGVSTQTQQLVLTSPNSSTVVHNMDLLDAAFGLEQFSS